MSRYYDPVTHRFINADGYFQSGGNILDANMSAYCANNPIMYSDSTGSCYWAAGTWCHDNSEYLYGYERKPAPNQGTKIFSADYKVGAVQQESSNYPLGWYTKAGTYYIEDYQPSYFSAYAFNNCGDLSKSEAGISITSISAFVGMDNLGIKLSIPIDNITYSLEATISLSDATARIGWDTTQHDDYGAFVAGGGGAEINLGVAALIGVSIYSYINGTPIDTSQEVPTWSYAY